MQGIETYLEESRAREPPAEFAFSSSPVRYPTPSSRCGRVNINPGPGVPPVVFGTVVIFYIGE